MFKRIYRMLCFVKNIFGILEYPFIANFALEHSGTDLLCQRMFQEFVMQYTRKRDHTVAQSKLNSA